jgi:hypothetical protein
MDLISGVSSSCTLFDSNKNKIETRSGSCNDCFNGCYNHDKCFYYSVREMGNTDVVWQVPA